MRGKTSSAVLVSYGHFPGCTLVMTNIVTVGYIPFVGYVTIMLSENPWMKTAMLGIMGLMVVLQRE